MGDIPWWTGSLYNGVKYVRHCDEWMCQVAYYQDGSGVRQGTALSLSLSHWEEMISVGCPKTTKYGIMLTGAGGKTTGRATGYEE